MASLAVNDQAPDFEAVTEDGTPIKLSEYRGKKVVLFFYPKDDTSGCTKQACGFRDHYTEINENGVEIFGISPDNSTSHQKFIDKNNLPYSLLVDSDHHIAESYGAWGEKSMYGRKYMGIIRSHFVIDEEGKLLDVRYKVKPSESVKAARIALGL